METSVLFVSIGDIWITSNLVDVCIDSDYLYRVRDNIDIVKAVNTVRSKIKSGEIYKTEAVRTLKDLAWVDRVEFELSESPEISFWITKDNDGFTSGYECADDEQYESAARQLLRELGNEI